MTLAIIMCLAYSLSLMIIFFSKINAKNEETRLYKFLLISNFIGLLLHLAAENVCYYYDRIPYILSFVVLKAILTYYYLFGMLLLSYLVVVSQIKSKKTIQKIIRVFMVTVPIIFLFMPIKVHRDMKQFLFYTYGIDCDLTYYLSSGVILIMIGILVLQFKKLPKKKVIPLFFFIIGYTVSVVIQNNYPHITIVDLIEALICCSMYFTIENPYENKQIEPEVLEESREDKYKRLREERLKEIERQKQIEEENNII
jgi:hypothetical protein